MRRFAGEALDVALTQGRPFAREPLTANRISTDLPLGKIDNEIPVGHPALAGSCAQRQQAPCRLRASRNSSWANNLLSIRLSDVGERSGVGGGS